MNIPQFNQYFLVSTVLPGLFNLLILAGALKLTFFRGLTLMVDWWIWTLLIILSVTFTLLFGMLIEGTVFIVAGGRKKFGEIEKFRDWRLLVFKILQSGEERDHARYRAKAIENLVSEYYFVNNIVLGITLAIVILFAYLSAYCLCPSLHEPILKCLCQEDLSVAEHCLCSELVLAVVMIILLIALLSIVPRTLRTWLEELQRILHAI